MSEELDLVVTHGPHPVHVRVRAGLRKGQRRIPFQRERRMVSAPVLHRPIFRADFARGKPHVARAAEDFQECPILLRLSARQRSRHRRAFAKEILLVKPPSTATPTRSVAGAVRRDGETRPTGREASPIDEQPFRHAGVHVGRAAAGFTPVTAPWLGLMPGPYLPFAGFAFRGSSAGLT